MVVHYPRIVWKNCYAEHEASGKTYESMVSFVSRRYMRVVNGSLVVCLSEYLPLRSQSYLRQIDSLKYYETVVQFKDIILEIGAHNHHLHQGVYPCDKSFNRHG